jgi:hypothetical protein
VNAASGRAADENDLPNKALLEVQLFVVRALTGKIFLGGDAQKGVCKKQAALDRSATCQ